MFGMHTNEWLSIFCSRSYTGDLSLYFIATLTQFLGFFLQKSPPFIGGLIAQVMMVIRSAYLTLFSHRQYKYTPVKHNFLPLLRLNIQNFTFYKVKGKPVKKMIFRSFRTFTKYQSSCFLLMDLHIFFFF